MATERADRTLNRGQRGFVPLCRKLGIRVQGCRRVTHYANDSVRAVYGDPAPCATLGIRVVLWLRPPAGRW